MSLGALECDECGYRSKLEHRFVLKAGTMFCYGCYDNMRDRDPTDEPDLHRFVADVNRNLEAMKDKR